MVIKDAWSAHWFLTEHPKFRYRNARLLADNEAPKLYRGDRIREAKDEFPWGRSKPYRILEYSKILTTPAYPDNLDIHYTKVNPKTHKIDDDKSKNAQVECWLEFGKVAYVVSDGTLHLQHWHDVKLDCGAPTFDEALVKLARLVKRHYGDFNA
jgi:hypothetical protein